MYKIPVGETITEAYRFTLGHIGKIIGLIWLPVVLSTVGSYFLVLPFLKFQATAPTPEETLQHGGEILGVYGFYLVALVLMSVIMVAIAREVLRPSPGINYFQFPFGGTTFRVLGGYLGVLLLAMVIFIAVALIGVVIGMLVKLVLPATGSQSIPMAIAAAAVLLFGLPALIYIVARLGFLMVASAVDGHKFGLERSWHLTKGNVWRVIVITLACNVPVVLVTLAATAVILGPDFFNPHLELAGDPAAMVQANARKMALEAARFPLMMGVQFFLAPFIYGLTISPGVIAYRELSKVNPPV
jgi:hypothetical protein